MLVERNEAVLYIWLFESLEWTRLGIGSQDW